jgi:hypothetical protein
MTGIVQVAASVVRAGSLDGCVASRTRSAPGARDLLLVHDDSDDPTSAGDPVP